jgi:hypothetical protein
VEPANEAEIEGRLRMVTARAHRPLTAEELPLVRARIEQDLKQRAEMRALPLANGDAPDTGFDPRIAVEGIKAW